MKWTVFQETAGWGRRWVKNKEQRRDMIGWGQEANLVWGEKA